MKSLIYLLLIFHISVVGQKLTKLSFNLTSPLMVTPSSISSSFEIELKNKMTFEVGFNGYLLKNISANRSLTQYNVRSNGGLTNNFGIWVNHLFFEKETADFFIGLGYTKSNFEYYRVTCDEFNQNQDNFVLFCNEWSEKSVLKPLNTINAGFSIINYFTKGKIRLAGRFDTGVAYNMSEKYNIRIEDSKEPQGTDFKEQNFPPRAIFFNKGITSLDNTGVSFYFLPSLVIYYEI